jgi:hypothetical protein
MNHDFNPPTNGFNMVLNDGGGKPNVKTDIRDRHQQKDISRHPRQTSADTQLFQTDIRTDISRHPTFPIFFGQM